MNTDKSDIIRIFNNLKEAYNKIDENNKLYPEVSIYKPDIELEDNFYTYKIKERESSSQTGRKPRHRAVQNEDGQKVVYRGQLFEGKVSFAVYGKEYDKVNSNRKWLEEFIYKQEKTIKDGIVRFLFENQEEDELVEVNKNHFIKQEIVYNIAHERIYRIPVSIIEDIETDISKRNNPLMPRK